MMMMKMGHMRIIAIGIIKNGKVSGPTVIVKKHLDSTENQNSMLAFFCH